MTRMLKRIGYDEILSGIKFMYLYVDCPNCCLGNSMDFGRG